MTRERPRFDVNGGPIPFPTNLDDLRRFMNIVCAVSLVHAPAWREAAVEARRRYGWRIVYDCMDDWSAFPGMQLMDEEQTLVAEADLVTVTSRRLQETWGGTLIRNASDFDHFSIPPAHRPPPTPSSVTSAPSPPGSTSRWSRASRRTARSTRSC